MSLLHYHLGTRDNNLSARKFFGAAGCAQTDTGSLYAPGAIDISYAMTTHAPRTAFMV